MALSSATTTVTGLEVHTTEEMEEKDDKTENMTLPTESSPTNDASNEEPRSAPNSPKTNKGEVASEALCIEPPEVTNLSPSSTPSSSKSSTPTPTSTTITTSTEDTTTNNNNNNKNEDNSLLSRAQKIKNAARKTAVAAGGGAMVTAGLVFIPTLPPPVGEVLIVGGVSLLGTEFEAPKRVMKGARDRLAKACEEEDGSGGNERGGEVEQVDEQKQEEQQKKDEGVADDSSEEKVAESVGTTSSRENSENVKKEGGGVKLKRFGRNVVVPFLDQVVGDKKKEVKSNADGENKKNNDNNQEEEKSAAKTEVSEAQAVRTEKESSVRPSSDSAVDTNVSTSGSSTSKLTGRTVDLSGPPVTDGNNGVSTKLCTEGCGFFGSADTGGYCSKCWKDVGSKLES